MSCIISLFFVLLNPCLILGPPSKRHLFPCVNSAGQTVPFVPSLPAVPSSGGELRYRRSFCSFFVRQLVTVLHSPSCPQPLEPCGPPPAAVSTHFSCFLLGSACWQRPPEAVLFLPQPPSSPYGQTRRSLSLALRTTATIARKQGSLSFLRFAGRICFFQAGLT